MDAERSDSRARMVAATVDLLRAAGLSGAGLNQVVATSGAPKGSLYHFFPGGKDELVIASLREAERSVGLGFRSVFTQSVPLADKVRALFDATAAKLAASGFTRSCPVGAVTLDLDIASDRLQQVCAEIFDSWCKSIHVGLGDVPLPQRRRVAQLILATLEGALMLARARANTAPLIETGALLAETLTAAYKRRRARSTPRHVSRGKT